MKQLIKHEYVREQLEGMADIGLILGRAVYQCNPKNYTDLLIIIRYLSISERMVKVISHNTICLNFFGIIIKTQATLNTEEHIDSLNTLLNIYGNPEGRKEILMNENVIDYIGKSLSNKNAKIANIAGSIVLWFFKDSTVFLIGRC